MSTKPENKTKFLIISYQQFKAEQTGCYLRHKLPQQMGRAANEEHSSVSADVMRDGDRRATRMGKRKGTLKLMWPSGLSGSACLLLFTQSPSTLWTWASFPDRLVWLWCGGTDRRAERSTHPWPIFSKRVYFFLGSPTLTMLPESKRKQKSKNHRAPCGWHVHRLTQRTETEAPAFTFHTSSSPHGTTSDGCRKNAAECVCPWSMSRQDATYYIGLFNNFCLISDPLGNMWLKI